METLNKMIQFNLHQKQAEFMHNRKRFSALRAGRRFGKTYMCVVIAIIKCLSEPNSYCYYIYPTQSWAKDIVWKMFKRIIADIPKEHRPRLNETETKGFFKNGSMFIVDGAERKDSLRGDDMNLAILDEMATMPDGLLHEIIIPSLLKVKGDVILTGTPRGVHNAFKKEWDNFENLVKIGNESYSVHHYRSNESPFIDDEEFLRIKETTDPIVFASEYEAEFIAIQGLVYDIFRQDRHVIIGDDSYLNDLTALTKEIIVGVDVGYKDPTAMTKVHVTADADPQFIQTQEVYERLLDQKDIIEYCQRFGKVDRFIVDCREPQLIEMMRRAGLRAMPSRGHKGSVIEGIRTIRGLLTSEKYKVSRECHHTIQEFEYYSHERDKEGGFTDVPNEHENNHTMDALRYCIYDYITRAYGTNSDTRSINELRAEFFNKSFSMR